MIRFEQFHHKHGLPRPEMLSAPPVADMAGVEFPTGAILHYLPEDIVDRAPEPTWWMIRKTEGDVWVDHITTFNPLHGKVTPLTESPVRFIRNYHQRYPTLKRVIKLDVPLGYANSTVVINHALARHYVKYQNSRFLEYSKAQNLRDNIFEVVNRLTREVDRHHFIPLRMPTAFPGLSQIRRAEEEEELSVESVKRFHSLEHLMFLEMWRWLGNPERSLLGQLDPAALNRVNLVFTVRNYWYFVNLGILNGMRKTEQNPKGRYEPEALQRRFLNGLIALIEAGVVAEKKPDGLLESPDASPSPEPDERTPSEIQQHNEAVLSQVPVSKEISSRIEKNQTQTLTAIGVDNSHGTTKLPQSVEQEVAAKEQAVQEAERSEERSRSLQAGKVSAELTDAEIDANLEALEKVSQLQESDDLMTPHNPHANPLEEGILARGRALAKDGLISGAEYRRIEALATAYKKIKNPYGPGLLVDAAKVTPEETKVEPAKYKAKGQVFDESMLASSVREVNRRYVKYTMHKDIMNTALCLQRSGIAVTSMEVDKVKSVLGEQDIISLRLQPIDGAASTIRGMMPVINEEGVFKSAGTRYRMRTQRVDVPIRKVAPTKVSLTSYYGKINVSLSTRAVHNLSGWLTNQISAMAEDKNPLLRKVEFSNVFDRSFHSPKDYSMLARSVYRLETGDLRLNFKQSERFEFGTPPEIAKLEAGGGVVCGATKQGDPVVMQPDNTLVSKSTTFGTVADLLRLDLSAAPHEMAMIRVRGQDLPLGVVMASYHGLSNLIAMLKANVRRVLAGDRVQLEAHEYPIRFSDETLVLDTRQTLAMMLLTGFRFYHKQIRQISIYAFDQKGAYHHLFDAGSRNSMYTIELELLDEQFVDPMTHDVLVEMKEPTEWRGLLRRSAELLLTDYSPDEVDGAYMLYKGYERCVGTMYKEMIGSVRQYKLRSRVTKAAVDMKPTAVWNAITSDSAISPVNDCNPIADLRASEAVTYIGNGGRSKRSMVARTRKMHVNDVGVVSEQTVDSGDVGINIYLTANPQIISTRGIAVPGKAGETGTASMVSTSALLAPFADIDDPKRVNFIGIQHGSGIGAIGYRTMPCATGYEMVLGDRTGKKFSYVARGKGTVSIKNSVLKVTYENGEVDAVEIGRVFTSGEGHLYPNNLVTTVKNGDTVEEGDALVYNTSFFEPSPFAPREIQYKHGVPCRVALYESVNTLEDSSMISPRVSQAMHAEETETRDIVIDFKSTVHTLVQVGDEVEPDDILCTMEDPSSAAADIFSDKAVDSLQMLVDHSPRAKIHGRIDQIEVLYNGDLEDMSPSLRKIAEAADRQLRNRNRELGDPVDSGRIGDEESLRINNQPLQLDTMVIRVYISHGRDAYAGDKGTLANQMKSVFGQVMHGEFATESGDELDMIFSDKSIEDRIVRSARKAGMYNGLLFHVAKLAVKAYRGA